MQDSEIEDPLVLQEGCKHEADYKDLAEEGKAGKNSNYDDLMHVSQCSDASNNKKEEATKFEEELKFLESWRETPCFNTMFQSSLHRSCSNVC